MDFYLIIISIIPFRSIHHLCCTYLRPNRPWAILWNLLTASIQDISNICPCWESILDWSSFTLKKNRPPPCTDLNRVVGRLRCSSNAYTWYRTSFLYQNSIFAHLRTSTVSASPLHPYHLRRNPPPPPRIASPVFNKGRLCRGIIGHSV